MIIKKGNLLFRYKKVDEEYIRKFDLLRFKKEYNKIKDFFKFKGDFPMIKICFIYSPEEYMFFTGDTSFQKWKCATTGYHTTIYIFSPSVIEKYTIHKKESIFKTIIHELSHLFYGYSGFVNLPVFNEGIAEYFKSGNCKSKINFKIPTLRHMNKDEKYDYNVGHLIITSIINHFGYDEGSKRVIKFLKEVKKDSSEEELFKLFKKIFGIDVNELIKLKGGIIKNEK